jgi:hypothetical protein
MPSIWVSLFKEIGVRFEGCGLVPGQSGRLPGPHVLGLDQWLGDDARIVLVAHEEHLPGDAHGMLNATLDLT